MPEWAPLEAVARLTADGPFPVDPGDFMWMGATASDGVPVQLYKHSDTRRYLNLDAAGHAYRYVAKDNAYVPLADLYSALVHVHGATVS